MSNSNHSNQSNDAPVKKPFKRAVVTPRYAGGSIETRAIHAALVPDATTGAILPSICQSTTYVQEAVGEHLGHTYSRASNPTVSALELAIGSLENAPEAVCFGTGMAATHALFLALLKSGDHVIVSDVVYGGTHRLLSQVLEHLGIEATFVDATNPDAIRAAARKNTKLIFIETPGNPTLKLIDIRVVSVVADALKVPLVVDNTFLTAVGQRPLDLGATASLYSTTKHIEGHNSTVGGAIVSRDVALLEKLQFIRKTVGSIQSPFNAWLTLRGLKTLPLRLKQHTINAHEVARWLEQQPSVTHVAYPGLESFPQAALAKRQHILHGGLLSFEVRGGVEAGRAVMNNVKLCCLAENLGAVETLITHPATMTHGDVPRDQRDATGITDGLIRLSVGLEDPADIIADLAQALEHGEKARLASKAGIEGKPQVAVTT
jgi:cystathionine beta-lyase/cystathionine gamma-synthase